VREADHDGETVVDSMVLRFYLLTRMIMELGKEPNRP